MNTSSKSTKVTILFADEKFVGKGKNITKFDWKAIYKNFLQDGEAEIFHTKKSVIHETNLIFLLNLRKNF